MYCMFVNVYVVCVLCVYVVCVCVLWCGVCCGRTSDGIVSVC